MMNMHLIIGAGNMGLRRAEWFKYWGEGFQFHDPPKGVNKHHSYLTYKSVWIATPPETHEDIITEVFDQTSGLTPIGVEKPLLSHPRKFKGHLWKWLAKSFVGCNYRFNDTYIKNIDKIQGIDFGYPTFQPMDFVHFYDLMLECKGKPSKILYTNNDKCSPYGLNYPRGKLTLDYNGKLVEIWGERTNQELYQQVYVNNLLEYGWNNSKDMFLKEMKHYFEMVNDKAVPVNPFSKALERTEQLYETIYGNNSTNRLETKSKRA